MSTYPEERLFILETLKRIDQEQREQGKCLAVYREQQNKQTQDLNQAHNFIRETRDGSARVERHLTKLETRAGYIAAASGMLVAVAFEVIKSILFHK